MLCRSFPLPVKFICGFLYRQESVYTQIKKHLIKKFGIVDFESKTFDFNFTHYYDKEMGTPLYRRFISFKKLMDPARLVGMKLFCIKLEKKLSVGENRKINIDPGYLNEAKFVLATTKDFSHRIYIGKGIYAEITLTYRDNNFQDLSTTYPDYRTTQYKDFFLRLRENYREQIKNAATR